MILWLKFWHCFTRRDLKIKWERLIDFKRRKNQLKNDLETLTGLECHIASDIDTEVKTTKVGAVVVVKWSACLLLRRSEFKSRWSLQFFCTNCVWKNDHKRYIWKVSFSSWIRICWCVGMGQFKLVKNDWHDWTPRCLKVKTPTTTKKFLWSRFCEATGARRKSQCKHNSSGSDFPSMPYLF